MPRCIICKAKIGLVNFDCAFCKNTCCSYHRLPEDHECSCIADAKAKYKDLNKKQLEDGMCKGKKVAII